MTLTKQLEEIYEALVGDNGTTRYTHEELIALIHDIIPPGPDNPEDDTQEAWELRDKTRRK